jgi:CheY-like chemotaxis protein
MPLRVLVVEDNAINQRLVATFLEDAGHTPVLIAGGREALAVLERESFDLILMDVQMPGMDGFQTTAAIRAREQTTGIRTPILAITAHIDHEARVRCLEAGMDGHIAKPVRYEELITHVERLGSARARTDGNPVHPAAPLGRRKGLTRELAGRFVEDSLRLQAEMREAIVQRDAATLQRAAHTLRGTAGLFLAQTVLDLAQCLENLAKAENFGPDADGACRQLADELARIAQLPLPE